MSSTSSPLDRIVQEISSRFKKESTLKPRQRDVLEAISRGENVFAGLPTGYGKSVCYWAPAAAWGWKVWVVSPLVSLIQDQSLACSELGLKVASWHGAMGAAARKEAEKGMREGRVQICFLSPERLARWWEDGFIRELEEVGRGPDLLALDEMHCFEDWRRFRRGFREAFAPVRRLAEKGVRVLGLSASLARNEAEAWMRELCPEGYRYVGSGLGRDNLMLDVLPLETGGESWLELVSLLRGLGEGDAALVYCATREETDEVNRWLQSAGFPSCSYHAGLPGTVRSARSRAFRQGQLKIICATSAFGMGVDFPRVRRVIHFSLPYSLEAYWQEAGRAGRDGGPAHAVALWRRSEITRARRMNEEEKERFCALWLAWASGICRKQAVANRLGLVEEECGCCDRCREKLRSEDGLPGWMEVFPNRKGAWWTEPEARLEEWVQRKIFSAL